MLHRKTWMSREYTWISILKGCLILLECGMQSRSGYCLVSMLLSSLVSHTTTLKVLFRIFLFQSKNMSMTHVPMLETCDSVSEFLLVICLMTFIHQDL